MNIGDSTNSTDSVDSLGCNLNFCTFDASETADLKDLVNFTDAVITYKNQNESSNDTDEKIEIQRLREQIQTRQQELETKKLEITEPEMKLQRILLERDKCELHAELKELYLNAETLKSKKTGIEEQIREVNENLKQACDEMKVFIQLYN